MRKSVHVKWDLMETISSFFDPNWIQSWISSSLQSEEGNHQFELSGRTGTWRLTLLFPDSTATTNSNSSCSLVIIIIIIMMHHIHIDRRASDLSCLMFIMDWAFAFGNSCLRWNTKLMLCWKVEYLDVSALCHESERGN